MLNELQIFNYNDKQVRTIERNGEPWFVASDVCKILSLDNTAQALTRLEGDEIDTIILNDGIGNPERMVINESGLYSLILGSRKPEAREFKKWVTSEVLPSIRKTGSYSLQKDSYSIEDPIERAKRWIQEQEEKKALESKVKALAPAAEFGNAVSNNAGGILIRDYVKVLENDGIHMGQDKFFSWLHIKGYIYRVKGYKPQWIPYKNYVEQGLFRVRETPISSPEHGDWISCTIRLTGKGQKYFYEKLKSEQKTA